MQSVHDFQPFAKETLECPFEFYRAMREQSPVFEASPGVYFVANHQLVGQVLKDTDNFTSKNRAAFLNFQGSEGLAAPAAPQPHILEILKDDVPYKDTLLSNDPPDHTRYRILVNRSLAPPRVARFEGVVRGVATSLIDAFIDRGRAEFVSEFSMPLPLNGVALALGVPRSDMAQYKQWTMQYVAQLSRPLEPDELVVSAKAGVALRRYLYDRVEEARGTEEDTVIGNLVNAHLLDGEEGEDKHPRPLDTTEIVNIIQQLLVAGQETVNFLSASLLLALIQNPDQMAIVRSNPSAIKQMIEEGVRYESPIRAMGRFAKKDVVLAGTRIPQGARVVILYASANRDPQAFEKPESFNCTRANLRDHMGFGAGPHYCVGAWLARMEARVAFEEILSRLSDIRLVEGANDFSHAYTFIFRALNELHIEFTKAPQRGTLSA
jgi:cytochrome P450